MTQSPLSGKCALITGAAKRIGAEIARSLHDQGMDLVLHYHRSAEAAGQLQRELQQRRPSSVRLLSSDLSETQQLEALVADAAAFKGRLDLLVNNASVFYPTPLQTASETQWDELFASNLKAPFFLAQAAAPWLSESRGSIINLVDIYAERPLKAHPIYSIAKAGNAMLVKSLAVELGPQVRVNGIAPGAILWPDGMDESKQSAILEQTPLRRIGCPKDIAETVLFLLRDGCYITGQIINVDGGRSLFL
ncbi:MAG: pteridine reductase [Candidatus Polarisedimenticolaceae bacterium]|nr:pteridine reductase [Candidatus Polarisedimenticolaceae bacterium]